MRPTTPLLLLLLASAGLCSLAAAEPDLSKLPAAARKQGVTYAKDIRPLLEASCFRCHGDKEQKGGVRLDSLEETLKGGKGGKTVLPGKGKESPLLIAVSQLDEEKAMPPKFKPRGGPGGPGPGQPPGSGGNPPPAGGRGGGGPGGGFGPPPKPLTTEQVALVRAWIEQGAK